MPDVKPVRRECGDCTLCCKLMGVTELQKPKDIGCVHCAKGQGCKIYDDRPASCKAFECLWLQGMFPEEFKPNKVHFIGEATLDGMRVQIHIDQTYKVDWENGVLGEWMNRLARKGLDFIVCEGERRTLISTQALMFKDKYGKKV